MSGYSGKPLAAKLGLPRGGRAAFPGAPASYFSRLGPLPPGLKRLARPGRNMDFIHLFAPDARALARRLPGAAAALAFDGALWISWPKRSAGTGTDLGGAGAREAGLRAGLVDVKICAVDETWSALKFVYRLKDRPRRPR